MAVTDIVASFFAAVLAAMGVGGGGLLVIYLVLALGMAQKQAQGLNLLFFISASLFSLPLHLKYKRIKWKIALPFASAGAIGAYFGCRLSLWASSAAVGKVFGWFLIVAGGVTLFKTAKDHFANRKHKRERKKRYE